PATQTAVVNVQAIPGKMKILLQSRQNELSEALNQIALDPMIDLTIDHSLKNNFSDYDMVILDEILTDQVPDSKWQDALAKFMRNGGAILMLQSRAPAGQMTPAVMEALPVIWQETQPENSAVQLTLYSAAHPIIAGSLEKMTDMTLSSSAIAKPGENKSILLENESHAALLAISQLDQGRMAFIAHPEILDRSDGHTLIRQIFQWLTRNPDLSDHAITANIQDNIVKVEYLSSETVIGALRVTRPDRSSFELPLAAQGNGLHSGSFIPDQKGVYVISDGAQDVPLVYGNVMTEEWQRATATSAKLSPLARATGGQIIWLQQNPQPPLRWTTVRQGGMHDWLPLRESRAMVRTGAVTYPAIPKSILLIFIAAALSYAWWRESQ
ncbi:MAG TPA: hypothetical protein PKW15_08215, partial [Alphaproteobacteria bacterium]|nr:hypothetical protein [Alphaproteobacteria bacterium]